jgi:hypothetical protein
MFGVAEAAVRNVAEDGGFATTPWVVPILYQDILVI